MNNCTGSLPDSAQSASPDAITIEILRSDSNPHGNLPSTFFPGAGSDGALFQVVGDCGTYPEYGSICDALNRWDSDNMLIEYDEKTGRGYFRIVDSVAPDLGEVITLPLPPVWDDQDDSYWLEEFDEVEDPNEHWVDPFEAWLDRKVSIVKSELQNMYAHALRRIDSVSLNLN